MVFLLIASLLWSLSFGMIKAKLTGYDPVLVAALRLMLSCLVFLPFIRRQALVVAMRLMVIGAVQFGVMYCLYIASYRYLAAHQVAALTITTPIFVVFIDALMTRHWRRHYWLGALLAVAGAFVMKYEHGLLAVKGVLLLQAANLCFAGGQLAYKRYRRGLSDARSFAWMYLGAMIVPLLMLVPAGWPDLPSDGSVWLALIYLGVVPSGIGFYLWNKGAVRVRNGTLAVMNNAKIPLAALLAWGLFNDEVAWLRFGCSLALMLAGYWVTRRR